MIDRYTLPKMREIWSEENKFRKWLEVELAVCEAWQKLGKIPMEALQKIEKKAKFSLSRINEIEKEVGHDLIAFLTSVAENVGRESRYIHLGLTSYDVEDTALSLRLRESAQIIALDLEDLAKVLKKRAKESKNFLMMGRTHGVHAEPITFGFKLVGWLAETQRNIERINKAKTTVSVGKISGAVGTYAALDPRIEEYVCQKLGLAAAPHSTQTLQRDRHAEYLTTLAVIVSSLEKFSTEIRNLQRTEILEVEEPFGKRQKGSSAMPHKKNPVTCERIAGLARVIRANAMAALENVALWHERDITHSSVERIILPDSSLLIDYMLQTFTRVMAGLVIYPENMKRNIERSGGLFFSQRLLLALVDKGLTREEAYEITQSCAMQARGKKTLKEIVAKDKRVGRFLTRREVEDIFDIGYFTRNLDKVFRRFGI